MLRKFLYMMGVLSCLALAYTVIDYFQFSNARNSSLTEQGNQTTANLKNQVDTILVKIVQEGDRLAKQFGSNDYTSEEVEQIIKESALSIEEIQGVTACFEPFGLSQEQRLYCPYYNKGAKDYIFVEDSYDYTVIGEGTAWYTGVRDNGATWVEPYYANAAQDWYIDYGIPFYYSSGPNRGKVRGTITMSFVASGFKKIVQELTLGRTGYGIITSPKGMLLSHPVSEYVGTKNLKELTANAKDPAFANALKQMDQGGTGRQVFWDKEHKDDALFYFDKIPTSDWGIGVLFYKNDLLADQKTLHRKYIRIFNMLSLLLLSLIAIYFNKDHLDENEIWQLSWLASVLLIANIVLVGYLQHQTQKDFTSQSSPPIVDVSSLRSFEGRQKIRADKLKIPHYRSIPTGMFVNRLEFEDSYNINVGGTVWQKYPQAIAEEINLGFNFPQMSPFAEASYIEESYRKEVSGLAAEDDYLLVGWDFRVTLRLNLGYKDYPFDKRLLNIELEPKSKEDHLLFTPDLESYTFTNPSKKPGLAESISISGNKITESYFNYSLETIEADFGYGDKSLFEEVPVLHYNVSLKRKLINAFVTYLIPIVVVLLMMFILVYASHKTNERQGIIESMAAFFFVLVFSHIDLRKEIVTADLTYMEYFYFVTYLLVILATFNLIIYTKDRSKLFDFNDNQLFKAAYFPIFFFLILTVTLLKFY